jgi:hypothetical protein
LINDNTLRFTLADLTKQVCETLWKQQVQFALAGGIPADLYRGEPRATDDIDILVAIDEKNVNRARDIILSLGYIPAVATEPMLKGDTRFRGKRKRGTPQIVVGRDKEKPYGVDLLLLSFPWARDALERSQHNLIDIAGIGQVPCMTVEDMIISKLFAIKNNSLRRYKKSDIPDIALMLENNPDVDLNYLSNAMENLELILPKGVEQDAPLLLSRISRGIRKKNRKLEY